jgi:hypothetical protein
MSFDLFQLLPAIYRIRDAQVAQTQTLLTTTEATQLAALQALTPPLTAQQQTELDGLLAKAARGPLQSLCMLIQEQLEAVAYDVDQLYDDQFIETCAPWVIPYIGDLIGYQSVKGIASSIDNPRAEVAETISLRRRKGTVLVMEQLARDATGWGAHAVEFFQVLADTQYMNHTRLFNHYAPDVRKWKTGLYIDRGFDRTAHKVDVRRIEPRRGRYNIQNIGIFLWSLTAYSVTDALATPARTNAMDSQWCYRFSSLGEDIPLFHKALPQGEEITAAAQPINVADRLKRRVLCDDLQKGVGAGYYGLGASLALILNGELLSPYQIKVADLSGKDGSWANLPAAKSPYTAVIDPELGRIALAPVASYGTTPPNLTVSYYYGFNGDVGGGEYAREDTFQISDPALVVSYKLNDATYATFNDALDAALNLLTTEGSAALEIDGSTTFAMTTPLIIDLPKGTTLEIRGAAGARPTIVLDGEVSVSGDEDTTLILNGLVLTAGDAMKPMSPTPAALVHMPVDRPNAKPNLLGSLTITDCTLVPGWSLHHGGKPRYAESATLLIEPEDAQVSTTRSILGAVRAPELATLTFSDSIIDATDPTLVAYAALDNASGGGALTLTGCTVIGKVHASVLTLVSNSILWGALAEGDTAPWVSALIADRKQQGCVRFSFLPYEAVIPRHFECVFRALASVQPYFFSLRYGKPGYCKLLTSTDDSIRRGADDGGEMGVFHYLLAPQRESDLAIRMQEYMPVGLEYGLIYQN